MAERKVPRIRFKGFEEDWEQRKLGEIAGIYDGVHQTPEYVDSGIMFLSVENIATLKSNKFISEEAFGRDYKNYPVKGDVLMTRIGDVGTANVVETTEKLAFYVSLALIKPNKIDSYYLCNAIHSSRFQRELRDRTLLTAVPKKINKNEIGEGIISSPTLREQELIGRYFRNLDSLLSLHQRKLEKLKILKKAMLEKMFPKNGAKVPEIRFSGFTDDWEQRKVSELADRYDNLRVPVAEKLRVRGTTPYYGANGIQDYVRGFTHDGEFVLVAEDGANDLKNYPVQYVNGRIWVNNHAHVLQAKDKIADTRFLGYAISRADIEAILVGGGRAKLNAEVLMRLALILPGRTEQIRLASFLVGIDSLLSLHQRKLEKLRQIKKSMLERMFV